jgi:hypothetical protein
MSGKTRSYNVNKIRGCTFTTRSSDSRDRLRLPNSSRLCCCCCCCCCGGCGTWERRGDEVDTGCCSGDRLSCCCVCCCCGGVVSKAGGRWGTELLLLLLLCSTRDTSRTITMVMLLPAAYNIIFLGLFHGIPKIIGVILFFTHTKISLGFLGLAYSNKRINRDIKQKYLSTVFFSYLG